MKLREDSDGVATSRFEVQTTGNEEIVDLTRRVEEAVAKAGISDGIALVFTMHTTAGVAIIEYEAGLLDDFRAFWRRVVPQDITYQHNRYDNNGHAHVRSTLLGQSVTVPVSNGRLELGTWQSIVLCEFDPSPRTRNIVVKTIGE